MATDTNLNQLVINKLTQAQYQAAKEAGQIIETELYMITDGGSDIGGNVDFASDDDVLDFVASMNYVSPIASNSNAIYVNNDNKIYTL